MLAPPSIYSPMAYTLGCRNYFSHIWINRTDTLNEDRVRKREIPDNSSIRGSFPSANSDVDEIIQRLRTQEWVCRPISSELEERICCLIFFAVNFGDRMQNNANISEINYFRCYSPSLFSTLRITPNRTTETTTSSTDSASATPKPRSRPRYIASGMVWVFPSRLPVNRIVAPNSPRARV